MSNVAIKELERAIKYREREIQSFKTKLELLLEQKAQYENDLIPTYQKEIEELQQIVSELQGKEIFGDLPF